MYRGWCTGKNSKKVVTNILDKKKLVFLIGGLNFGGMERVVFIAKELLQEKYDIKIVTLYQTDADYDKNKEYYNIDVPPSRKRIITFVKRLMGCIRMKKKLKPDIVFSFGMYLNYLNVISNLLLKHKPTTIAGIRSYDWLMEPFFSAITDKWVMNQMDKVNSVSKLIAKDAQRIWGIPEERNPVIYNPYNVKKIEEYTKEIIEDFKFDANKYYIITMGRLADQKGYNHLIRAFSIVSEKYDKIELIILGNGERREKLLQMIDEYSLDNKVHLLGGKINPYKYVNKANLYVLSSLSEGFPNALAEAMCVGTPVVSVNCKSGPAEILFGTDEFIYRNKEFYVGDYGILCREMSKDKTYKKNIPSKAERSLANAICYAYCNQDKMQDIAKKAKLHMNDFSYTRFSQNLEEILE